MDENEFLEKLKKFPYLRASMEDLMRITENQDGSTTIADIAEERIIENLRDLGKSTLQDWADKEPQRASKHLKEKIPGIHKEVKKK